MSEEEYSSCDDDIGLLKKALDVVLPDDFDPKNAPTTGEQYLQHVIYERQQYEEWVRVDIDECKLPNMQTALVNTETSIPKPPIQLLPSYEWQLSQVKDFLHLRKFLSSKVRSEPTKHITHESHWVNILEDKVPTFSLLSDLTQTAKLKLLNLIYQQLHNVENGNNISYNVGKWIYGILAMLELPLSPDDCHNLRAFIKKLALIRSGLSETTAEDEYVHLNLCICLMARVFGQLDLADPGP